MSAKVEKKKNEKVINDRTFGLKNKNKSKVVQKYVKGVEQTVKNLGPAAKMESEEFERRKEKKKLEEEAALLNSLYSHAKKIHQDNQSDEEDPSNTVCPYFKQGLCQKGKKCIYSHDLTLDRTEQIDLYVDQRTQLIMNALGGNEMSELTEEELSKKIGQKESEMISGFRSDIVCKHFLEAAQKEKYGWNWSCPNGGDRCKYKHCLPPGYRLRKDAQAFKAEDPKEKIEQKIDEQRNLLLSLNKNSPLVTYDVFMKWKDEKILKREIEIERKRKDEEKRSKDKKALRTGKELFKLDPTMFVDDEEAAQAYDPIQQEEEGEEGQEGQEGEEGEEGQEGEEGEEGEEGQEGEEGEEEDKMEQRSLEENTAIGESPIEEEDDVRAT